MDDEIETVTVAHLVTTSGAWLCREPSEHPIRLDVQAIGDSDPERAIKRAQCEAALRKVSRKSGGYRQHRH